MSEPYLILHKVRGAPAFDIAEELSLTCPHCAGVCNPLPEGSGYCSKCSGTGVEKVWVIPTSGHRAYPSWALSFEHLGIHQLADGNMAWGHHKVTGDYQGLIPLYLDHVPDHYRTSEPPPVRAHQSTVPSKTEDFAL